MTLKGLTVIFLLFIKFWIIFLNNFASPTFISIPTTGIVSVPLKRTFFMIWDTLF